MCSLVLVNPALAKQSVENPKMTLQLESPPTLRGNCFFNSSRIIMTLVLGAWESIKQVKSAEKHTTTTKRGVDATGANQ